MNPTIRQSFCGAALALGMLSAPLGVAGFALAVPGVAHAETAPTLEQMKQTLGAYGDFVAHAKYGEVWKPTVTPRGWHPYPACDWVYTKDYGWYFSDKTPWGGIVHHYGRWIHEAADGWLWVPGAEFSPGWVVWRTSAEWVGWAPTPPDAELTPAALEAFDDDRLWTFMDAKKFGATCEGATPVAQYGDIYRRTTLVTDIRFVGGVGVFVLPPAIIGPVVNVNIGIYAPWSVNFIGSWVWNWTNIFNDVDINITLVKTCGPNDPKTQNDDKTPNGFKGKPLIKDINDAPPPRGAGPNRLRTPSFQPTGPRPKQVQGPDLVGPDREITSETRRPNRTVGGRSPGASFEARDPKSFGHRNPRAVLGAGPGGRHGANFDRGVSPKRDVDRERGPRTSRRFASEAAGGGARSFASHGQGDARSFRRID